MASRDPGQDDPLAQLTASRAARDRGADPLASFRESREVRNAATGPTILERGADLARGARDLVFPQDPGRRGLPDVPARTREPTLTPPIKPDLPPVIVEDKLEVSAEGVTRVRDAGPAPGFFELAERDRDRVESLGLQPVRIPLVRPQRSLTETLLRPFQRRAEGEGDVTAVADASGRPEPITPRRSFGSEPPTIRSMTAPEQITFALNRATARDHEALKSRFEKVPLPARMLHSFTRGAFDAVTVGHVDELVNKANQVVAASMGVDAPALTTEDIFEIVERGLLEKGAGGLGFLGGAGLTFGATNRLIAGFAPLARTGTTARVVLESFDPNNPVSLGTRALQGAIEGLPFDLAFDAEDNVERARNVVAGLVIGAILGPIVGGRIREASASPLPRAGATAVAEEILSTTPTAREVIRRGEEPTETRTGRAEVPEELERGNVLIPGPARRGEGRKGSPGRRDTDPLPELDPTRLTTRERITGRPNPARLVNQKTGLLNQDAWELARPRIEADPELEIVMFDLVNFKGVNDNVSMAAGDAKLREVAEVLLAQSDVSARQIFRVGGDEFAVVTRTGDGAATGRRIQEIVGEAPIADTGKMFSIRFGVGQTADLSNEAVKAAKGVEVGPRFRGARKTSDVTVTRDQGDLFNPDVEVRRAPTAEGPAGSPTVRGLDASDPVPKVEPIGTGAKGRAGFFDLGGAVKGIKGIARRRFTSAGDLPKKIFEIKIRASGWVSAQMSDIRFTLRKFDDGLREAHGKLDIDEGQVLLLDNALKGKVALDKIPEAMRGVVTSMREQVDALSRQFIELGLVEGDMAARIADNMGTYLTRSYRLFDDPDWILANIPPDIVNKAKSFLRSERPDLDADQLEGLIKKILHTENDSPLTFLSGTLGSKDLSMLIKRKDIHPSIRALMGEFTDARVNYARSVTKLSNTLANHEFLTEVRRTSTGTPGRAGGFFFEQAISRPDGDFVHKIAADQSQVMAPLNGLHTTPEIAKAFDEVFNRQSFDSFMGWYMKANGIVKFNKTVLSLMTHNRNLIGNIGFAVANGHWRMQHAGRALAAVNASVGASRGLRRAASRVPGVDLPPPDVSVWELYYKKLQRLGVVDQSAHAGELQDAILDATKKGFDAYEPDGGLLKKALTAVTDVYRAEDDFWKVIAFENEFARYRKALPDLSIDEVEEMSAWVVRNTYPTYSLVPSGIKALRRVPVIGSFTSFPAEVYRTLFNTITIALKELKDPRLKSIGAQRLAGLSAAALLVPTAATASRFMNGITKDEDRDLRHFLAPWSRNSTLIYTAKGEDSVYRYIDLSYTDPYSYVRDPIKALLRGEDWQSALAQGLWQAAEPFLGEEILFGKVADITRNTKTNGGQVWNPQDHPIDKFASQMGHIYEAMEPGTITSARRIAKGIRGTTTVFGQAFDTRTEAMAVVTGHRLNETDVAQSLSFRGTEINRAVRDANRILTSVGTRRGTVTEEDLLEAYQDSERSRAQVFRQGHEIAQSAIRLGRTRRQVLSILREGGMSQANSRAIVDGTLPPAHQLNSENRERNALIRTLNQAR